MTNRPTSNLSNEKRSSGRQHYLIPTRNKFSLLQGLESTDTETENSANTSPVAELSNINSEARKDPIMITIKENINSYLKEHNLSTINTPSDGHCLLHATIQAVKMQKNEDHLNIANLKSSIDNECKKNPDLYSPYIGNSHNKHYSNSNMTPPDILNALVMSYINDRKYNTTCGDIIPLMLANLLSIPIHIIIKSSARTVELIKITPNSSVSSSELSLSDRNSPLFIYKDADHYSGLRHAKKVSSKQ